MSTDDTRPEIMRALRIGQDNALEVMAIWLAAEDVEAQRVALQERFGLTRLQAEVIVSMQSREFSKDGREWVSQQLGELGD